ncbi:MAG: PAS domain S-box protein [Nitrospirae bacterium]|nr:PAS domain S-box protein [Nitrospirota bacterium]
MTWRHIEGDFELTNYNDALGEMTDGKISSYLGKRASEMYPDCPEIIGNTKECYRTHRTLQEEVEHRLVTTGQVRTLRVTAGFVPPDLVIVHTTDISTHKRMERELQAANEDLQRILDVMGEGVVVLDEDGRMTRLNKKACELFGRAEEDILGQDYSFWTHPDSRDLLASEQGRRMHGMRSAYDARLVRDDGTPFWAHIIAVPVINDAGEFRGSVGCLRDVTQEKESLAELQRLHEFNQQLVKTAGVWISVTEKNGKVVLWNDEAEKISGYSGDAVLGNNKIWEWLYPDSGYRAKIWKRHDTAQKDAHALHQIETVIHCKNGEERTIHWYGRPRYDEHGEQSGWVLAGHDVTESKNNMQRLQDYAAQVERLSREKTRFLSVASHELRTPLTIINGFVDLLAEDKPRPDQKAKLARVQLQLERLTQLLDDLLSVSRIDTGKSNLSPSLVDLNDITRKVVDLLTPQAVAKGLRIVLRNDHSSADAYADAGALMQVLTNILLNAISYTPSGGKIVVSVSGCSNKGRVVISDTGMGIGEEERKLIFSEFHRSDRARKVKANGNGLGLSIVKRLVDEMNGTIWVKSAGEDKGSTFSITLPGSAPKEDKEEAGDAVSNL